MKRLVFAAGLALALAGTAAAMPPRGSAPPPAPIGIAGVREVGSVVHPASPVPAGSTCTWLLSGSAVAGDCTGHTVTTADASAGANALQLDVKPPAVTTYPALGLSASCPTAATVGSPYSCSASASGGTGAGTYGYALSGAWPAWATIAAGVVSGTPAAAASFPNLSIAATDAAGGSASISAFTLTVSAASGGASSGVLDLSKPDGRLSVF